MTGLDGKSNMSSVQFALLDSFCALTIVFVFVSIAFLVVAIIKKIELYRKQCKKDQQADQNLKVEGGDR